MRTMLVLLAVVAAVAGAGSATATAAPVRSTLSGAITSGGGWCCGSYGTVEGTANVVGIGRVSFSAYRETGRDPYAVPMTSFTIEQVVLTAMNGDTLTLAGGSDTQDSGGLIVPWSVVGGTGRFSSASGSGTFSFNLDWGTSSGTIALTGTLLR